MTITNTTGVSIAWAEQGAGTPVLLIMGHSFPAAMWWPVAPDLATTHRVVTFDNRGVGGSGLGAPFTVRDMVADAVAVLDAAGVEQAHVYGVSMGGGIALELAISHPERVRSLVLGCTMAKTVELPPPSWAVKALARVIPGPLRRRLSAKKLYGDTAPADRVARDQKALREADISMAAFVAQAEAIAAYTTTEEQVGAVTAPTLVLHGTLDTAVPHSAGKKLSQLIPGARLVSYEDARHNYLIDFGAEANREVLEFFDQVDAALTATTRTQGAPLT